MTFGMKPVGTIAHEWIMAVGAKQDYVSPNGTAMDMWEKGERATSPLPKAYTHKELTGTPGLQSTRLRQRPHCTRC